MIHVRSCTNQVERFLEKCHVEDFPGGTCQRSLSAPASPLTYEQTMCFILLRHESTFTLHASVEESQNEIARGNTNPAVPQAAPGGRWGTVMGF